LGKDTTDQKKVNEQLYNDRLLSLDTLSKADYFDHMSANIVIQQDAKKMFPCVNGEIINYKLGVWTQKKFVRKPAKDCKQECKDTMETYPRIHFLPFSIISKVSGNYADSSAGPINDATSFFGAPLTLRFSPAADLTPKNDDNKLFFGVHGDLRLLMIGDTVTNSINTGWGVYLSGGFTYMGKGYAYEGNEDTDDSKRYYGKWSISGMFYWFKSGGTFNKAVFGEYEPKNLSGFEAILRFKTSKKENSKFNFIFGASNGFTRGAPDFAKWQFRLGVGS